MGSLRDTASLFLTPIFAASNFAAISALSLAGEMAGSTSVFSPQFRVANKAQMETDRVSPDGLILLFSLSLHPPNASRTCLKHTWVFGRFAGYFASLPQVCGSDNGGSKESLLETLLINLMQSHAGHQSSLIKLLIFFSHQGLIGA